MFTIDSISESRVGMTIWFLCLGVISIFYPKLVRDKIDVIRSRKEVISKILSMIEDDELLGIHQKPSYSMSDTSRNLLILDKITWLINDYKTSRGEVEALKKVLEENSS